VYVCSGVSMPVVAFLLRQTGYCVSVSYARCYIFSYSRVLLMQILFELRKLLRNVVCPIADGEILCAPADGEMLCAPVRSRTSQYQWISTSLDST